MLINRHKKDNFFFFHGTQNWHEHLEEGEKAMGQVDDEDA